MARIICGVDVSSTHLDARLGPDGPAERFANTPDGIARLAAWAQTQAVELVALEATGGYERQAFLLLWEHGLPCAVLNPRQVRRFAEAMGVLEKTDRIDAGLIAHFAAVKRIAPQQPASAAQDKLKALVTRLGQLTALSSAQQNQRRLVTDPDALASIDALLALIAAQIRALEIKIAALIDADPLWRRLDKTFREIKGVADRTVARLMAELPQIGTLTGKQIAKLAGLAPLARDSGKVSGRRPVRAGRAGVRAILYVVAEIVRRFDPAFAACHARLLAAGKPRKVVRIALARKLLVCLNAKARDERNALATA